MAMFFAYPFGIAGTRTTIPQPTQGGGAVAYQSGYTVNYEQDLATVSTALPIDRGSFNELMYETTLAIQQYQTEGAPDWIFASQTTDTNPYEYDIYARVRYNVSSPGTPGAGNLVYENQVQGNTATPGADATWLVISGGYQGVPIGTVIDFAASTAPAGYLPCDGSMPTVSRTTYANLFAVIGTTWGAGDGSTTFGLPPGRRVKMGSGGTGTGTIGNAVGDIGGVEAYQLLANDMAPHVHSYSVVTVAGSNAVAGSNDSVVASQIAANTAVNTTANNPVSLIQPSEIMLMCIKY
jgi:microcystin-dependent protein